MRFHIKMCVIFFNNFILFSLFFLIVSLSWHYVSQIKTPVCTSQFLFIWRWTHSYYRSSFLKLWLWCTFSWQWFYLPSLKSAESNIYPHLWSRKQKLIYWTSTGGNYSVENEINQTPHPSSLFTSWYLRSATHC